MKDGIIFLVDGGFSIGAGHYYRCWEIVTALIECGKSVLFYTCFQKIRYDSIECFYLESLFSNDDRTITFLNGKLNDFKPEVIVVDSHRVTEYLLNKLKIIAPVVIIDDIPETAWPVHTLINGHVYANTEIYKRIYEKCGVQMPNMLLGPNYCPLRRFKNKKIGISSHTILFMAGGSDPEHATVSFLNYLIIHQPHIFNDMTIRIIVGSLNSDIDKLNSLACHLTGIELIVGKSDLTDEYNQAFLAISAAGISLYELANMGIPVISYSVADNQIPVAKSMDSLGCCRYVGDIRFVDIYPLISTCLSEMKEGELEVMSERGRKVFDGYGSKRIAQYLSQLMDN